jgi:putative ABC transport system permease protein
MRQLLRRAWYAIRRCRIDEELAEEMAFHRAMTQREIEAHGVEPTEAAHATRRAFGSTALAVDQTHDVWVPPWLQGLGQDGRLALRTLFTNRLVSTVAILSLALGIGANTAIFSLVNSLLLRTLPVADPERLVTVSSDPTGFRVNYSYATFDQIRQHGQAFDGALASDVGGDFLAISGEAQSVYSDFVSGDFFSTLGVLALLGRTFTPSDDVAGGGPDGPVAVISYRLWQRRFGGAAGIVGRSLTIEHVPVTIVGVVPPTFLGVDVGQAYDLFLPIKTEPLIFPNKAWDADTVWLRIMLRLRRGQSLEAATAALRAVQPQIRAGSLPQTGGPAATAFLKDPLLLEPGAGRSELRQRFQRPLVTILVVVALVLLMACANIANLQLARGAARRHELSVRLALGASRWRLARQLLMDSVLLATIGATLGLVFAAWASRALVAQLSPGRIIAAVSVPVILDLSLDGRVLAFTAATMVATVILFGLVPALRATRVAPMDALKAHSRWAAEDMRAHVSSGLLVAQVAVSLLLVVAAGLFVRTFERLSRVSLGFDRDRVLSVMVTASTVPAADRNALFHSLVRAAAAVPGVARAGGSIGPPLTYNFVADVVATMPGTAPRPDRDTTMSEVIDITPGWLGAYGTVIRAGRDVDEHDTKATPPVMLVNEAFVRRLFPSRNLVGTTLALTAHDPPFGDQPWGLKTVIGVVGDAVYGSLREPVPPTIYYPLAQRDGPIGFSEYFIAVRSSTGSPVRLTRNVAAALTAVNPDIELTFRPLDDQVSASLTQDRVVALLSGFFGVLAVLLAALGLFGVTAYAVARRRAEIGIRMALGAGPAGIVRLVLGRVFLLVGLGVTLGAGVSLAASTFVSSLLYGVEPRDWGTLVGAAATLVAVGVVASWLPAYRAARIDPAEVLRET